ncbi:penicillin-binding protein 2, partial [Micromonospora sp. NPDC005313]
MPPRSEDPRRDATGSRRGSSRGSEPREPGLGGISDARAYTPRGRTVREGGGAEQRRTPRSNRSGDPFRPALQVLDGGRAGRAGTREPATDGARSGRRSYWIGRSRGPGASTSPPRA